MPATVRTLSRIIPSVETSDGAGVKLRRSLGRGGDARVDPFLMLDAFGTENPDDYIAGFPPHPHRGFETVTYMIDGHLLHEDNHGNRGELRSGGVQWMSAGRGIVHSEMPQQKEGRMRGFQLWINLPAAEKMKAPAYRDIQADEIPVVALAGGGRVKVIAGTLALDAGSTAGPLQGLTTDPLYIDADLPAGAALSFAVTAAHNAYAYVYEGAVAIGADGERKALGLHQGGVLTRGDRIELVAGPDGARCVVLAGKPLNEPVAQYGPFVMNTEAELRQAVADYQAGRF